MSTTPITAKEMHDIIQIAIASRDKYWIGSVEKATRDCDLDCRYQRIGCLPLGCRECDKWEQIKKEAGYE